VSAPLATETFYDVATSRLDEQTQRIDALDTKVATAFGFAAAVLPLFGVLLALAKNDRPHRAVVLYGIAMGVYLAMIWFVALAYDVGKWSLRPDLDTLQEHCEQYPDETMRVWVANECVLSIAKNEPRLHVKAARVRIALGLLCADAFLLTLAAFFSLR
jgi:hypothetical protein